VSGGHLGAPRFISGYVHNPTASSWRCADVPAHRYGHDRPQPAPLVAPPTAAAGAGSASRAVGGPGRGGSLAASIRAAQAQAPTPRRRVQLLSAAGARLRAGAARVRAALRRACSYDCLASVRRARARRAAEACDLERLRSVHDICDDVDDSLGWPLLRSAASQ
jgi:hypothetical protein